MDFSLDYTPEQEKFAKEVGTWLEENLPKDFSTNRDAQKMTHEEYKRRRAFAVKMDEKGWLYPTYPKEHGGGGMNRS